MVAAGLTAVVVLAVVGWVAGRGIRSPAEVAAGVAPPQPSLITVPVVRRKLATEVIVRGTARYGAPQSVILPTSTLKSGSELVSQAPLPNAKLREGTVALSVSGRPIFVLRGALPANRDLAPGTEGADVMQLEQALARLGFSPGAIDGRYDGATATAVTAWYLNAGWTPFAPTAGQDDQLRTARATAATARDAVLQTRLALQTAARGATPAEVNQTRQDANTAADGVNSALLAIAAGRAPAEAAREAGRRARVAELAARLTGRRDAAAVEADLTSKQAALSVAIDASAEAQRRVGQFLPQPEEALPARKEALRVALRRATEAVAVARSASAAATAADGADLATRQAALNAAINAQIDAQRRVDEPLADTLTAEREARATALRQAMAAVSAAQSSVEAARSALAAANAVLAAAVGLVATAQAGADVRAAESTLVSRRAALAAASDAQIDAQRRVDGPLVDTLPARKEALQVALRQATEAVAVARSAFAAATAAAEAGRGSRQAALSVTIDAQADAQRRVDQPLVDTLAARKETLRVALRQTVDAVAVARSALAAARAAAANARSVASAPVLQAQADARAARRDARLAAAQIARARQSLATSRRQASLAHGRVSILTGKTDTTLRREILAAAQADAQRADGEVARLGARTGVQIPAGEVLFFPVLPLRVDTVTALRGAPVSGAVMTVSNSRIAIDSSLSINDARLVRVGLPVAIEEQDLRITLKGRVTRVANKPGTVPTDPQRVYFEVTPESAPPALVGASVRLAIAVSGTHGAVLAVPVSALSVVADGTSRVQVDRGGGRTVFVTVVPGLAAQGLVEVRPVGGQLRVGDLVVVGVGSGALASPGGVGSGTTTVPAPSTTPAPAPATTTAGNAR